MKWDESRLTQVEAGAKDCPDACAADVISLCKEVRRLTVQRDNLIRVFYMVGGDMEHFAQCPCCLSDRARGEWHTDDCPMVTGVER